MVNQESRKGLRNVHPVNKILSPLGLILSKKKSKRPIATRESGLPEEIRRVYEHNLAILQKHNRGFDIIESEKYQDGQHPTSFKDYECGFAAYHLGRYNPERILDIGSYRHFVIGLLAHCNITTIDIRSIDTVMANETIITCDAKNIDLPDDSFDAVMSLSSVEHFGLGRYGDEFDPDADKKACNELIRILSPGGCLIITVPITRGQPCLFFNTHRIYDYGMIRALFHDMNCVDELYYSRRDKNFCSLKEVTRERGDWDVYCGCFEKE